MARARLAVEEVLHFVPADPGAGAIRVRLDRLGSFFAQDRLAVGGRGRVGLQDPDLGASEDGRVGEGEALVDRAIGRAEHFFHRDAVDRVHRVHQHGAKDGRQVIAAALQPRPQPPGLAIEDAALLEVARAVERQIAGAREAVGAILRQEVGPAGAVPVLPDDARPLLHQVLFQGARGGSPE